MPIGQDPGSGAVFYGGLRYIGVGTTPRDALALYIYEPQISPALPPFLSDEKSFYVWVEAGTGRVGMIEHPFSKGLLYQGLALANDKLLMGELKAKEEYESYLSAIDYLEKKALDAGTKAQIAALKSDIAQTSAAIDKINDDLAKELERQKRIDSFLSRLKILGALVSAAEFAIEFSESFPDAEIGLPFDDDMLVLEQKIVNYKAEKNNMVVELKGSCRTKLNSAGNMLPS